MMSSLQDRDDAKTLSKHCFVHTGAPMMQNECAKRSVFVNSKIQHQRDTDRTDLPLRPVPRHWYRIRLSFQLRRYTSGSTSVFQLIYNDERNKAYSLGAPPYRATPLDPHSRVRRPACSPPPPAGLPTLQHRGFYYYQDR